ncbi:MAG: Txe/YoeB family addiction module toxin [Clostridiales bacterium]|jgi:toxin YoeB|nr:Txe/YoeB family addiction module toxin [Clostridiales bacterium]
MSNLIFLPEGWDDYLYWQEQDKKTLRKINQLLKDISRSAYNGMGKPEPLRDNMTGWWSRRIDDKNRLVYRMQENDNIEVAQCRGHYNDK